MPLSSGDALWFQTQFGFDEPIGSFQRVQEAFELDDADGQVQLTSKANGRRFFVGRFEAPTVAELRERLAVLAAATPHAAQPIGGAAAEDAVAAGIESINLSQDPNAIFEAIDTEQQGAITEDQLTVAMVTRGVEPDVISSLFSQLDQDADGVITTEEFTRGFEQYLASLAGFASDSSSNSTGSQSESKRGQLRFENISGDAKSLHLDPNNAGGVFQVASQFNCLEMIGPGTRPEDGVTQYYKDKTQGPICAMTCPAATVYRNYFVPQGATRGQAGGSRGQIDTTSLVAELVNNKQAKYWSMKNGYLLPTQPSSLKALNVKLAQDSNDQAVTSSMKLGVHWETEVSKPRKGDQDGHRVCQVFSSAVPVSYAKSTTSQDWAPLACAILNAQYEGTLAVAAILAEERQCRVSVYLTSVGGGAFGNRSLWIVRALERALAIHKNAPLDVRLVHYMRVPKGDFSGLEKKFPKPARRKSASKPSK